MPVDPPRSEALARRSHVRPDVRADIALAATLAAATAALWFALRSPLTFSDGRTFVEMLERGRISSHHVAYPVLARTLHALLAPLGAEARATLEVLNVVGSGLAAGFTYAAARRFGCGRALALAATLLLLATPSVVFFSTHLEVHTLHLAVVAGTLCWLAGVSRDPEARPHALALVASSALLFATHITGALALPALWLAALRSRHGWRRPSASGR